MYLLDLEFALRVCACVCVALCPLKCAQCPAISRTMRMCHVCARCNCSCSVHQPIIHLAIWPFNEPAAPTTRYMRVPAVSRPRRMVEVLPPFAFPAAISTSPPSWAPPSARPSAAGFPLLARRKQRKMRTKHRSAYIMLAAHTTSCPHAVHESTCKVSEAVNIAMCVI